MSLQQIGLAFFSGLETEKPALAAENTGATFYATDTKKLWIYDNDTSGWAIALEPLHIITPGTDHGDASKSTTPPTPTVDGEYFTATEPGDYINFAPPSGGLKGVAKGDVLIWDGNAWTIEANSNLIHHTNGMVSTPEATIAAISGGGDKVLVTKEYVLSSAIGAMEYKGTWNAATNAPNLPLPSSDPTSGNKGHFYIVDTAGTQTLLPATTPTDYAVGDWVMSDGTNWDKVDNTSTVASVFGRTGVIVSQAGDYALAQITGLQTALDLKAPIASPTFTGTVGGITKAMVGLTDVDDTSDVDKPVSTAQQTEIDTKEDDLGAPTTDGQILSSTIAKARTWIDAPSGGGGGVTSFITRTGAVIALTADYAAFYEGLLAAPGKDDQILSSKIDLTKSWVDLPTGVTPTPDQHL
jgi:hypothetical protein